MGRHLGEGGNEEVTDNHGDQLTYAEVWEKARDAMERAFNGPRHSPSSTRAQVHCLDQAGEPSRRHHSLRGHKWLGRRGRARQGP